MARGGARGESDRGVCPGGRVSSGREGGKKGYKSAELKLEQQCGAQRSERSVIARGFGLVGLGAAADPWEWRSCA